MNAKDVLAVFQLQGTRIVSFKMDNDFISLPKDCELSVQLGNNEPSITHKDDVMLATLQLKAVIEEKDKNSDKKISLDILIEGLFSYSGDNQEEFKRMLLLNGNSTLYSVIRSDVLTLSSLSLDSGKVLIPLINFLKLNQLASDAEQ